jgi:hypothetical protein
MAETKTVEEILDLIKEDYENGDHRAKAAHELCLKFATGCNERSNGAFFSDLFINYYATLKGIKVKY